VCAEKIGFGVEKFPSVAKATFKSFPYGAEIQG